MNKDRFSELFDTRIHISPKLSSEDASSQALELIRDARKRVRRSHSELIEAILDRCLPNEVNETKIGEIGFDQNPVAQGVSYRHEGHQFQFQSVSNDGDEDVKLEKVEVENDGIGTIKTVVHAFSYKEDGDGGIYISQHEGGIEYLYHNSKEAMSQARQFVIENYPLPEDSQPEA